jgi:hypothetical protein
LPLPETLFVGLAATSHEAAVTTTSTFEQVQLSQKR